MVFKRSFGVATLASLVLLGGCGEAPEDGPTDTANAAERSQIRIVGSSTVYPFSSYVAEEFGATTDHPTPVVESTGSGGGMKLFCAGNDLGTPDITNASRRMQASEYELCRKNGVTDISEAVIGYDGIVVAHSVNNEPLNLSREQITLAVAARVPRDGELVDNPYTRWSQIDASLPDREIVIYGPPTTSGTRDAFAELALEGGAEEVPEMAALKEEDGDLFAKKATTIRMDGKWIDSGENDTAIVGIFNVSFGVAALGVVVAAAVEAWPLPVNDNIRVPVTASLVVTLTEAWLLQQPVHWGIFG